MPFPPVRMTQVRQEPLLLKGGLDLVTPTLSANPGMARDGSNYEVAVTGGYARVVGYERVDGRFSPSEAITLQITINVPLAFPSVGDTVTGGTSGATGVVSYVGDTYVALTKVSGDFAETETLTAGATTLGTADAVGGSQGSRQDAIIDAASADIYRADIAAPPGAGAIRGVFYYNDVLYAVRDNAGGTQAIFYQATSSGWTAIPYYYEVGFTAAAGDIADGYVVNQAGNTALIKRLVVESGDLAAGTAAGRFIIEAPSPGAFAAGAATLTGGSGGTATLAGAQTQITRPVNGRYEFVVHDFYGQADTERVYGCDGVGLGFEFDGDVIVPIITSTAPDTPKHVAAFKDHLFFAFKASAVHSSPGLPYNFQAIDGASEIAVSKEITGFVVPPGEQQGGAMAIYGRDGLTLLYGNTVADWKAVAYGQGAGAIRYSAQYLQEPMALSNRGVQSLQASLNYGNFDQATLTSNIQPLINSKRSRVSASLLNRSKSQYRLFFSDGSGLFLTHLNGKYLGAFPIEFPHTANCAWNGETSTGDEVSFFGGTDGMVYELEKGTSFDGAAITATFTLVFNSLKSPRLLKEFRHAAIEIDGNGYAKVDFGASLAYRSSNVPQPNSQSYEAPFSPTFWDSFTWDAFYWDGVTLAPTEAELRGTAENIAVSIGSGSNYIMAYTINSIIFSYSPRRQLR